MNINIKKTILSATIATIAVGGLTTSCVKDLDVTPINPQQTLILNQDALLNKIYASFALTGQNGGAGSGDIPKEIFDNEGMSGFYRMSWSLNEFTSDEAGWVWSDAGVPELLHNAFAASNTFSFAMYYRLYFTITLCNSYLDQASDPQKCAEARLIRALNYMYVTDLFGAGPMSTPFHQSWLHTMTANNSLRSASLSLRLVLKTLLMKEQIHMVAWTKQLPTFFFHVFISMRKSIQAKHVGMMP
jgi:hypothetical protein